METYGQIPRSVPYG